MTLLHITPPAVPVEVTAAQVVAYLLREGSGWCEDANNGRRIDFTRGAYFTSVPIGDEWPAAELVLAMDRCIALIARAENRSAVDVVADILGPVVGKVGAGCESLTGRARRERNECMWAWLAGAPRAPEE